MTPDARAWSVYKPDALPRLPERDGGEGRIIALTATDEAISLGWATEIALGLARGWAGKGRSVMLIDADLLAPALHEALAVENATGLTDLLLFGSSLAGVSHGMEGGRFQFVTAGSSAAKPELAFEGDRWPALCKKAVTAEWTILVFAPYTAPWSSAILRSATDIIVLAATTDLATAELRLDTRVRAVLGVSHSEPAVDESAGPVPEDPLAVMDLAFDPPGGLEQPGAEADEPKAEADEPRADVLTEWDAEAPGEDPLLSAGTGDPLGLDTPADLAPKSAPTASGPTFDLARVAPVPARASPAPADKRSRARSPLVWGSALFVLATIVVVQVVRRPEVAEPIVPADPAPALQPPPEPASTPAPEQTAPPAGPAPEAVGPPAGFTVTLAAYPDLAAATFRADALSARTLDHLIVLAPLEIGGTVYHRLLAGFAPDAAAASGLSAALSETLGAPSASWIVRNAPLAFELARSSTLDVATERRDQVRSLALPAYVMEVEMSDGSVEYRVYVGAYSNQAESSHLRSLLEENGLADVALVQRLGAAVR